MLPNTKPQQKNSKSKKNNTKSSFSISSMNNVWKQRREESRKTINEILWENGKGEALTLRGLRFELQHWVFNLFSISLFFSFSLSSYLSSFTSFFFPFLSHSLFSFSLKACACVGFVGLGSHLDPIIVLFQLLIKGNCY